MADILNIEEFLEYADRNQVPIVDVRSPKEYDRAHIPGALSIPLFNDSEREVVGTKYKQINREAAMFAGLEFVGKKMVQLAKSGIKIAGRKKTLMVHCWRGGMRSESMAWLFGTMGLQCYILKGGYKSYRSYLRNVLQKPLKIIIIAGKTGTGKTDILKLLEKEGEQVINLEELANHKGSAFGALGEMPQPSTEHFENLLLDRIRLLDPEKRIWIEDESRNIGKCALPAELYDQMKQARTLFLDIPQDLRAERLVVDYAKYEKDHLISCVQKIQKKLGGDRTNDAIRSIEEGDFRSSAVNMLQYYDKAYMFSLEKNHSQVERVQSSSLDPEENMKLLMQSV